jgi:hypothetical protein
MADTIEAVRICHTLGYRRLGLSVDAELYPHWIAGFELSTARLGIARTGAVLSLTTWDETAFLNWQKENDFDAIIANHGIAPLVAWEKNPPLKSRPGLVALDVGENHPGLSGFHQRRAERDRVAIETLHNLLRRRSGTLLDGPITIEVASVWQPGNTLPGLLG